MNNLCQFLTDETEPDIPCKKCISCKKIKPLTEYGMRNYTKGNRKKETINTCKTCKLNENKIISRIKKQNPLPDKDYLCPGCLKTEEEIKGRGGWEHHIRGVRTIWRVDHDHKTGAFRAYICDYCNNVLGRANDDPSILRRLADFVEYFNESGKK